MPTFLRLIELTTLRYHVKLHQNVTYSFQVIGYFLLQKYENSSQSQMSPNVTEI